MMAALLTAAALTNLVVELGIAWLSLQRHVVRLTPARTKFSPQLEPSTVLACSCAHLSSESDMAYFE